LIFASTIANNLQRKHQQQLKQVYIYLHHRYVYRYILFLFLNWVFFYFFCDCDLVFFETEDTFVFCCCVVLCVFFESSCFVVVVVFAGMVLRGAHRPEVRHCIRAIIYDLSFFCCKNKLRFTDTSCFFFVLCPFCFVLCTYT
jgi:hypothetical protein